ncbi:alcohol [Plasmopara halstedii]|uniref:Alcohol n=1 Tax=Plasmopara halstedii TaxID=4781 RepID=A0A0P1AT51_PLAHL|nr:alcohol [Plasmopara halstedii]CEG44585.1 alcohol [Plasmopara halstedii]|eukprot:XP_024580954.1 alcohol [Plasmopara halstedii]
MSSFKVVQVHTKSKDFRAATKIVDVPAIETPAPGCVVVKNCFLGINATDINVTSGAYTGTLPPPFGCGLEAAGRVFAIGEGVTDVKVGDSVGYQKFGAFAEYVEVPAANLIKTPELSPSVVTLTVGGLSASIALEHIGEMKSNETVFVSAAAGGTGQYAVQLAKLAGNHVIGTCSTDEKAELLKKLGCDRAINYMKEDVDAVLKKEYPNGLDLVFESVGGDLFKAVTNNLAVHARVILFGYISAYHGDKSNEPMLVNELSPKLLTKSASLRGFILFNHFEHIPSHTKRLLKLIAEGSLNPGIDSTEFRGLESIPDAIDYMYARKNMGKLIIKLE